MNIGNTEIEKLSPYEADILNYLYRESFTNQRILAQESCYSIGVVNRSLKRLKADGLLDDQKQLTPKAMETILSTSPRNAIILAAGFGMRMVPINMSAPKALLEVKGERLIDRLISQLHEAGITDITVVVGFMKDSFEYLIDEKHVHLVYNPEYASRNNLHSLALVEDQIENTYIIPCDIWCRTNPFGHNEFYSWYMVSDTPNSESTVRVNRRKELVTAHKAKSGNRMIGIAYLSGQEACVVRERLRNLDDEIHYNDFWEIALFGGNKTSIYARVIEDSDVIEINTYEQLRDLDSDSNHLKSGAMCAISSALKCSEGDIRDIGILKKGMTNRSFLFSVRGEKYIMRFPGEGTDQLINRKQEAEVFRTISGLGFCDDPVYIDPQTGYKVTRYLENVRTCKADSVADLRNCMGMLRKLHQMKLTVPHTFDIIGEIQHYEALWEGSPSIYKDYTQTKENVLILVRFVEGLKKEWCLTHIDAVPDNFLFYQLPDGTEALQLIDWEYSGMQDPHVDIAMFCIYSLYNRDQCDRLIDIYFEGQCDRLTRAKIYAYISMCGLLWSNWCEYKRKLGVEFGEYSLRQYRYAKEFYRLTKEFIEEMGL